MEREKMIKEIAKKVCIACGKCKGLKGDCYLARNIASVMIDDGYRKIPDGAVVLTKEEYDNMRNLTDCAVCEIKGIEKVRKETAREILGEFLETFPSDKNITTISRATVKRLAQIYGVEVKE